MKKRLFLFLFGLAVVALLSGGSCQRVSDPGSVPGKKASLRLYVVGGIAGAIEPCGCVANMLGGIDHLGAVLSKRRPEASQQVLLGAGPMLFADPRLVDRTSGHAEQNLAKSDALAASLKELGFVAWAPGLNDWAAKDFPERSRRTGATPLAANLSGPTTGTQATRVVSFGNIKLGLAGVSEPKDEQGGPESLSLEDPTRTLKEALLSLQEEKADVRVVLAAMDRGAALRLAESVPGFQLMVVGKPFDRGEQNDTPTDPVQVGNTLVVQAPNHAQSVAIVDLFVQDSSYEFAGGAGLDHARDRGRLERRIHELESGLTASRRAGAKPEDLNAREADLKRYRGELSRLVAPEPPRGKSFFRYELVPVREELGSEPRVKQKLDDYYRKVNDHNRATFADVLPEPAPEGQSSYLGALACASCHVEEAAFWKTTPHAHAYDTLSRQHKEYNLDCASCHVTGYEKPGGSTLVHVEKLKDVQCEVCHGPGSRHVADPAAKGTIAAAPERTLCARSCHHPPHVETGWNVDEAWPNILGPGHGL